MYDPAATYVSEDAVRANTELATLRELECGAILTTSVELWSVRAGERWLVEDYTRNGWITLVKQTSSGLNCWDDVAGGTRKVRATGHAVRRITCADAFHHLSNR